MKAILVVPRSSPLVAAQQTLGWLDAHRVRHVTILPPEDLAAAATVLGHDPGLLVWRLDGSFGLDPRELMQAHESGAGVATLALRVVGRQDEGVRVERDHSGRILRFARHDPAMESDLVPAGCAIVSPEELARAPVREDLDPVRDLFSARLREHAILFGWVAPAGNEEEFPLEVAGGCA